MIKRLFDVVASGCGLVLLSPLMLGIAVLLRVKHGSPVLFCQVRIGLRGEPFQLHKFRTMESLAGPAVTAGADPRIHSLGSLLRTHKLDELPQLWDVFRGRMSIVGPRPEVPEFCQYWPSTERDIILSVRPGITDPASVRFRHESQLLAQYTNPREAYIELIIPKKCQMYAEYVRDQSFGSDIRLIATTLRALIRPGDGETA